MSANFDYAMPLILKAEGFRPGHTGLVDDPDDPGGPTNFGISLKALRKLDAIYGDIDGDGDVDADDIKLLDFDAAMVIYREFYWTPLYDDLLKDVAYRLADHWVNAGQTSSARVAQRTVRAHGTAIKEDGVLGPKTVAAITNIGINFVPTMRSERAGFYRALVRSNVRFAKYKRGWLNRAYS